MNNLEHEKIHFYLNWNDGVTWTYGQITKEKLIELA